MVRTSFAEKKRKKKIRLKQNVSLRSKGRHNNQINTCICSIQVGTDILLMASDAVLTSTRQSKSVNRGSDTENINKSFQSN